MLKRWKLSAKGCAVI